MELKDCESISNRLGWDYCKHCITFYFYLETTDSDYFKAVLYTCYLKAFAFISNAPSLGSIQVEASVMCAC